MKKLLILGSLFLFIGSASFAQTKHHKHKHHKHHKHMMKHKTNQKMVKDKGK